MKTLARAARSRDARRTISVTATDPPVRIAVRKLNRVRHDSALGDVRIVVGSDLAVELAAVRGVSRVLGCDPAEVRRPHLESTRHRSCLGTPRHGEHVREPSPATLTRGRSTRPWSGEALRQASQAAWSSTDENSTKAKGRPFALCPTRTCRTCPLDARFRRQVGQGTYLSAANLKASSMNEWGWNPSSFEAVGTVAAAFCALLALVIALAQEGSRRRKAWEAERATQAKQVSVRIDRGSDDRTLVFRGS